MSRVFRHFILALSVASMACSGEHPASPSQSGDEEGAIAGLVVSNAVVPATSGDFAAAREELGSAFVSAAPNTFTVDALYALIRNETSGGARVRKTISEGGFDPVKLDGKEGDDVSVALYKAGGDRLSVSHIKIPPRRPPRVVRTSPGKGRVDVALNTLIEIVFSEPINRTTVAPASVRLVTGGADVDGTLAVSEDGLVVRFTPAAGNLNPSASYRIVLASALRDLDSEPLDPLEIEFSTASQAISGSILIRIETTSISGAPIDEDGYFIQMDALPPVRVGPGDEKRFDELIGLHSIDLSGMSDNCIEAESHRSAMITPGTTTTVLFQVRCTPPPPLTGRLVFLSERDGNSEIYTSNADGTGIRRLTNNVFAEYDPQWSPDGTRIAFARSRDPEEPTEFFSPTNSDIYVMNADGSNVVQLTQGGTDWHPAWSPDGRKIAYAGWKSGYAVISELDLSGGSNTSTTVGYDVGFNTDPAWLPGGHYITFSSDWYLPDFAPLIFQVRADGSEAPTLFFPATFDVSNSTSYRLGQPSWSPDGSRIAFAECEYFYGCWGSGSIVVMYNSRSGIKRVVDTSNIAGISWSPDGAYIAYSSQTCRLCTPPSISYVSPDGTQKGLIISNAFSPSWTGSAR